MAFETIDPSERKEDESELIRLPDKILKYSGHTIKQYKLDSDETFYTWEKPDRSIEGILRYNNAGVIKTTDKLEAIFHKLQEKENLWDLPQNNKSIKDLLYKTAYRREINFESARINAAKVKIHYKLDFKSKPLNKYKGYVLKRTLATTAALAIPSGIALGIGGYFDSLGAAPYFRFMETIGMGFFGVLLGGLGGLTTALVFSKNLEDEITETNEILEEAIKTEQKMDKLTKRLVDYSNATHHLTGRQLKKQKKLEKKQDEIFQRLTESFKLGCVSISGEKSIASAYNMSENMSSMKDTEKKLIKYFNELRSEITPKEAELILKSRPKEKYDSAVNKVVEGLEEEEIVSGGGGGSKGGSGRAKPPEPNTKTLDEITLAKDWKKDEKYGELIDGRYELQEKIGEGALGRLYKAKDIRNDHEVVVKFEKDELGKDTIQKRKELHLKLMRLEEHENFIPELDANLYCSPAYIVNALIQGADLKKILDSIRELNEDKEEEQFLNIENIINISRELANALTFLHENSITHYDVKPENVIVDLKGNSHLGDCDLGSVQKEKMASVLASMASMDNGKQIGTPNYMSPQMRGIEPGPADERADIYSLGVTLGELVSNEAVPRAGMLEKRDDVVNSFKRIIAKCQEPKLKKRYQAMQEVLDDLNNINIESKPLKLRLLDAEPVEKEEVLQESTAEAKQEPQTEKPAETMPFVMPVQEETKEIDETEESDDGRRLEGFA